MSVPDRRRSSSEIDERIVARSTPAALLCAAVLLAGCQATERAHLGDATATAERATVAVVRQDLVARDEHRGSLGHGDPVPLVASTDGTVTALPEVGAVLSRGELVAEIDGVPVRLLYGDRPAWRRLTVSGTAADEGLDVRQLNDNLAALGHAERDDLPDERFDWRTREAVRRWQETIDRPPTGAVELGEVAFAAGPVRVADVVVHRGARVGAGETMVTTTGTEPLVTLDVAVAERDTMPEGQPVTVVLPDRSEVTAAVRSIGWLASAPEGSDGSGGSEGDPSIRVTIGFDGPLPEGIELDAAPVRVDVERILVEDALVVPVSALVALTGGGYAVDRVDADGATERVPVRPGEFAHGLVTVSGRISEGDEIVVPS